jgi:hypothetical protein
MAEALKDSFGVDVPERIAKMSASVYPSFNTESFLELALRGYLQLEVTPRARHISDALAEHFSEDRARALEILLDSLD